MLNLPTTDIASLLDRVLAKHSWTQDRLAKEMGIGAHAVSRWRGGNGIHKVHYDELQRLAKDEAAADISAEKLASSLHVPFEVTIPRSSLRISLDKNGDINIKGVIQALLNKEDGNEPKA